MLSSIANLLPSSLHLNPNQELPRPNVNPDTEDEEDAEENNENEQNQRYGYQEAGPQPTKKEKEKEGKMPNEVCVLVLLVQRRQSGPSALSRVCCSAVNGFVFDTTLALQAD